MDYEEGVERSDSPLPVSEAQPVVSPFTSIRGGGNINRSQRNVNDATSDRPTQAGQRQSQPEAEAQIGAYFLTMQRHHWPDRYKINYILATPPQTPHLSKMQRNHG